MKTKVLYVIVSTEIDIYLEQAYISINSVKHHMPDCHISVIMDRLTERSLTNSRKKYLNKVDEIIVVDLNEQLSGQQRSRILKTSFRNHIKGDVLFIDCDTLIIRPLDEIDNFPAELAACRDSHSSLKSNPYRDMCIRHVAKLGYNIENEEDYFNSGVILARDTDRVRDFFKQWNSNWLAGREKGIFMDQPSFAVTNIQFNHMIVTLPDVWNCQILHGVKYLFNAKIVHYLCTNKLKKEDEEIFLLRENEVFQQIKDNGIIPLSVTECFDDISKGIPETVNVLAGNNMRIAHSNVFNFLQQIYGTTSFQCVDHIFGFLNKMKKLPKYISKKLK